MNYPVTTPFGQVADYPLNNGFHNGIDYGYPMGTPVVVNGATIGISNNTGTTTGPHLHVGKWSGGSVQDPGVGNGFTFASAVVTEVNEDTTNGKYVRIQGDGYSWVYLHLESQLVTVGQVLQGDEMTKDEAYTVTDGFYRWGTGEPPTPELSEYWATEMVTSATGVQQLYEAMKKQAAANANADYVQITDPVFKQVKKG